MSRPTRNDEATIAQRLKDFDGIHAAFKRAARDAMRTHARAGVQIAVWKDGQVVLEDAVVEDEPPAK